MKSVSPDVYGADEKCPRRLRQLCPEPFGEYLLVQSCLFARNRLADKGRRGCDRKPFRDEGLNGVSHSSEP